MPEAPDAATYAELVARALAEDIGSGDITTAAVVPPSLDTTGTFLAKADMVVAGLPVAAAVFAAVDSGVRFFPRMADGERATAGAVLATVEGRAASLLVAERTALNFLQHLSGIATATRCYVDAAAGRIAVFDTRKTLPGLRSLAKYAVRCGGGRNHRIGLFDAVLIKDNHIRIAGSLGEAVRRVRAAGVVGPIEVETQTLAEVDEALRAGVDIIMLDNFGDAETRDALDRIQGRARVELSGNMNEDRVAALASSGADFVSIGALTHSARAADISLELAL